MRSIMMAVLFASTTVVSVLAASLTPLEAANDLLYLRCDLSGTNHLIGGGQRFERSAPLFKINTETSEAWTLDEYSQSYVKLSAEIDELTIKLSRRTVSGAMDLTTEYRINRGSGNIHSSTLYIDTDPIDEDEARLSSSFDGTCARTAPPSIRQQF